MPVDPAHHRLLHGRGTRSFSSFTRYAPLPSRDEGGGGSTGSTPSHSPALNAPTSRGGGGSRAAHTEVRLSNAGQTTVHLKGTSGTPSSGRTPIARPCNRLRNSNSVPGNTTRYTKLGTVSEEGSTLSSSARHGGSGILRAVTSRGRGGYEDLRCRGTGGGGDAPDSGDSSTHSSPRGSPTNSRKKHSGILITSAIARSGIKRLSRTETATQQKPASKVRVTFYESSKPLVVTSPEPSEFDQYSPQDFIMASPLSDGTHLPPAFDRQLSTESGRDNPFRPDGDISREADEIVQLIKSGRPLQGQQGRGDATDSIDSGPISPDGKEASSEPLISANDASPQQQQIPSPLPVPTQTVGATTTGSPGKAGANGSAAPDNSTPGTVEVTHATVKPTDAAHVEHVVIKKKSKCNCCVIQ
ncbi:corneodesmosin isoform X3 [Macrobrachium rosenbergii]|uniref:corneodesmosin isoform X3 n=1 Tax=Macrobrachium rosenbergii TaxID=79674 RepID=UPI0034D574CF